MYSDVGTLMPWTKLPSDVIFSDASDGSSCFDIYLRNLCSVHSTSWECLCTWNPDWDLLILSSKGHLRILHQRCAPRRNVCIGSHMTLSLLGHSSVLQYCRGIYQLILVCLCNNHQRPHQKSWVCLGNIYPPSMVCLCAWSPK